MSEKKKNEGQVTKKEIEQETIIDEAKLEAERLEFLERTQDDRCMELKRENNLAAVYLIEIDDKFGYIKGPDRNTYRDVMTFLGEKDMISAGDVILNSCWLEGDTELLTDDSYSIPAAMQAIQTIDLRGGSIKKK